MKNKYVTLLLAVCVLGISCKKYLDEKSNKNLVVPSTVKDLQGLLDDGAKMNVSVTPSLSETYADDYFVSDATYNAMIFEEQQVYNWQPIVYNFKNDWAYAYLPVYNANLCLELIEKMERNAGNAAQWDNVKGSAFFYRAYYFMWLTWQYAKAFDEASADTDLGIVLRLGSDPNQRSVRSTVRQSYDQVISDAKAAVNYLPDVPLNVLRPSRNAAYALLARTYLSMRQYDSAYRYADLSLRINSTLLNYNTLILTSTTPFPKLDNPETIFYTTQNVSLTLHGPRKSFIDSGLYASYNSNDLRRTGFFNTSGNYHGFKGSYAKDAVALFTGLARDEMLLIRSECAARKGAVADAMNDLNTLLLKRWNAAVTYVPATASGQTDAIDKVLRERRKELVMRCLRLIDIKRLNKEGAGILPMRKLPTGIISLPANDKRYALPIPTDIIASTGIQQN